MRADHECLLEFLRKFGRVHGKLRAIPLKIGDEGLGRGIFSTSREVLITINQGVTLPQGFWLDIGGTTSWIEVTTEAKCFACNQVGHFVATCPKKSAKTAGGKPNDSNTAHSTAGSQKVHSTGEKKIIASDAANAPPAKKQLAQPTGETESLVASLQGSTTSSDEEASQNRIEKSKEKRRKRRMRKSQDKQAMPPPSVPLMDGLKTASKRPHSGQESDTRSTKLLAIAERERAASSDCEMTTQDALNSATDGYESGESTLSILERLEMTPRIEHQNVSKERLRELLRKLNCKKNPEVIWETIKKYFKDPLRVLPELEILEEESRRKKEYNYAQKVHRLCKKIEEQLSQRLSEDFSHP